MNGMLSILLCFPEINTMVFPNVLKDIHLFVVDASNLVNSISNYVPANRISCAISNTKHWFAMSIFLIVRRIWFKNLKTYAGEYQWVGHRCLLNCDQRKKIRVKFVYSRRWRCDCQSSSENQSCTDGCTNFNPNKWQIGTKTITRYRNASE